MDISFFGIRLRLNRLREREEYLDIKDVAHVNDDVRRYLDSLNHDQVQSRLSSVSFPDLSDLVSIKKCIDKNGIAVVPGFVPPEVMQELQPYVNKIRDRLDSFMEADESVLEDDALLLQKGLVRLSSYQKMASYEKAVVNVRKGQDEGMIDIFNVDKWLGEVGLMLRPFFESDDLLDVLGLGVGRAKAKNLNLYFNNSVTRTRGFHVDSYARQLKGFVYLSDVLSLASGPYTYVKGSHVDSAFRRINKKISSDLPSKTESPIVSLEDIVPVLAGKGALVISDQGGAHRGFPQTAEQRRTIAVMNYE